MKREDAIEIIRKSMPSDKSLPIYEALQTLVNETAESEDERIRKILVDYFASYKIGNVTTKLNGVRIDDILAYLEKQKEPFESGRGLYYYDGKKATYCGYPATEEKQKDYHELYKGVSQSDWFKQNYEGKSLGEEQKPIDPCDASWDAYYQRGYERGLEVGRKEQKPTWSEEDEKKINFLSRLIEFQVKDDEYCFGDGRLISKQEAIEMLKSLRPVSKESLQSWKPSEEQMEALEYVIRDYREDSCNATANYLQEILDHLKNM